MLAPPIPSRLLCSAAASWREPKCNGTAAIWQPPSPWTPTTTSSASPLLFRLHWSPSLALPPSIPSIPILAAPITVSPTPSHLSSIQFQIRYRFLVPSLHLRLHPVPLLSR